MHEVTILHVEGCAGAPLATEVALGLATSRDDIKVQDVLIDDGDVALARGFRGSPTVLVDGRDVEADPQTPVGSMG